jgi:RND family efflux transporter MFP subunit
MKLKIYFFAFSLIFFSCNNIKKDTASIIDSKDLKLIQNEKSVVSKQINFLQKELKILNDVIFDLDKNQKLPLVTNFKVTSAPFKHYIEVQGSIDSDKNLKLYPEIPGIIKSLYVKEGQKVSKGMVLVELSNKGIMAQIEQMKLQVKLAKTIYERQLSLWKDKIGSEIQFLQAETNYLSLKKNIDQLEFQITKSKIIAPFDGIIDELIADPGSNVSPGITPVLRIINLDVVKVKAEVPETHISKIKINSEVFIYTPVLSSTVVSKISAVGNIINPNNRNFRIEVMLKNNDYDFKPNMTVKISINDYKNSNALLVSQKNIIENSANEFYVFKLDPLDISQNKFTAIKTFVKLGKISNNKIEVLEGLNSGDLIVEDGIRLLTDKQIVKSINY